MQKQKVYVVALEDINDSDCLANDCEVFSTKEFAQKHFNHLVKGYKDEFITEKIEAGDVEFNSDEDCTKNWTCLEDECSFEYWEKGYFNSNRVIIKLYEKEMDPEF